MIRTAARAAAIAVISLSVLGFAGTAFADEDPNAGGPAETVQNARTTGALPEACTLLPEDLAQATIDHRTDLTLTSTSGGAECLYQAADGSGEYAVDLDVSEQTADSLDQALTAWSFPGVAIDEAPGLGDGAFVGLNNGIDAVAVCAKDGVQFDIEVWAPDGEFAVQQVLNLAKVYCTPDPA